MIAYWAALPCQSAGKGGEPAGIWLTQAGDAKVRVSKCGGGSAAWWSGCAIRSIPRPANPQVDDKNPNPALAKRPMIGLPLFSGMRPNGPDKWSGQIYNADDGSTYASNISVAGPDTLRVEGCVGALCGGETWTRVGRVNARGAMPPSRRRLPRLRGTRDAKRRAIASA